VSDPDAHFGAKLGERTLVPGGYVSLAETRFEDWLGQSLLPRS